MPHRMNYQRRGEAMASGMDLDKIEVIDLTVERDTTADERAKQIMLQGYVHLGTTLGLVEPRS